MAASMEGLQEGESLAMGARGPRPYPTAVHALTGNASKRPLQPEDEPTPAAVPEDYPPPEWLPDAAKVEWRRLAPILSRNGVLTEMDIDALAQYCHAFIVWKRAHEHIIDHGFVVTAANGLAMLSPHVTVANKAWLQMKSLLTEFGMTPSSRTRVRAAEVDGRTVPRGPVDPFAEFDTPPAAKLKRKKAR